MNKNIKEKRLEHILNKQFKMTDNGRIDRIKDLFTTFNEQVDFDELIRSNFFENLDQMMEPITISFDDRNPKVLAYWAKLGMVKEFHGEFEPMSWSEYEKDTGYLWTDPENQGLQNRKKLWNSFVPVSAFSDANKGRKYPTVVVLHGGFNPISIIDGWGFIQEAAKREWIVIVPSIELDSIVLEILDRAKQAYPIDESRIYCTGFSYGGFMTNLIGNKRPDIFAAIAPCGAPMSNGYCEEAMGPEPQEPFDGISRAKERGIYMPIINIYGELDGFRFPFYNFEGHFSGAGTVKELVDGLNHWLDVNDAGYIDIEDVMSLKNRDDCRTIEKKIGVPQDDDCGIEIVRDDIISYIAEFRSKDGIIRTKLMNEINIPHWPIPELARQAFEFFSHFKRDLISKESIYIE